MIQRLTGAPSASYINLQYADETLIFGKTDVKEALVIKYTLCCFEAWSGLKINFSKNFIVCLGEKTSSMYFICNIFRGREERFSIKYLGTSIKPGRLLKEDWNPLFDSMER